MRLFRLKRGFTLWIYMIEFNEFSVLLHKLNSPATPWPLKVKVNINLPKSITRTSKYTSI